MPPFLPPTISIQTFLWAEPKPPSPEEAFFLWAHFIFSYPPQGALSVSKQREKWLPLDMWNLKPQLFQHPEDSFTVVSLKHRPHRAKNNNLSGAHLQITQNIKFSSRLPSVLQWLLNSPSKTSKVKIFPRERSWTTQWAPQQKPFLQTASGKWHWLLLNRVHELSGCNDCSASKWSYFFFISFFIIIFF